MAATILETHSAKRAELRRDELACAASLAPEELATELRAVAEGKSGRYAAADVAEAAVRAGEATTAYGVAGPGTLDAVRGRWQVTWSGTFTPLQTKGLPAQNLWVNIEKSSVAGEGNVMTVHSGVQLLFGAYLWTSCAGELVEADEPLTPGGPRPVVLRFNRYWVDVGGTPRPDPGRIDGGLLDGGRLAAFAAALLTPVLLEVGLVKWLLERLGIQRVFEVEVPSAKVEGEKVKLEASLELYLTFLAMVAFPETLSTCPVPYLDAEAGVAVYEIPMLGFASALPRWLHPGGNSAAMIARRMREDEEPTPMRA
eukprot:TRINITY_DN8120_c1_g1_i5.p1 TRINITY_DN8120_c1_g1~~TRINITY_DN8120_c1_g1_i5.p1  ORF type:complete len:312 (+),score=75.80 TRINITY_DN8120_c1_g1_i5:496-1431(+)